MIIDRVRCAADAGSTPRYGKGRFSAQSVYFRCRFSHGPAFVQTDASDVQSYSPASACTSQPPTTHKQHHHQHPNTAGSYSAVWTHEHSAHTRSTLEDGMRMPKWQGNGFSKEGKDHTAQNQRGSDLDGLVRVWPNTSGLEARRCAGISGTGFWQDATTFPLSDSVPFFHRRPG